MTSIKERFATVVASVGGVGFVPASPGTAGTLVAVPLVYFLIAPLPLALRALIFVLVTLLGVWVAGVAEKVWNEEDSSKIVIDEVAGFLLTMLPFPAHLGTLAVGFGLFRLFDIAKPYPCRKIDREMEGGWGVMLDDLAAAVYAMSALALLQWVLGSLGVSLGGLGGGREMLPFLGGL